MRAWVLERTRTPLQLRELPDPRPGPGEVVLAVRACAICRTDLHVVDGELPAARLPLVPGHQIVGDVTELGEGVPRERLGERVGVPWIAWTCGACARCRAGQANLCERARFTGYQVDGGYATRCLASQAVCFPVPAGFDAAHAAPLLCAGAIGYRALRLAGPGQRLGIYGFGSAARLVTQLARHQGRRVHAFTRPGDHARQELALMLGCASAAGAGAAPPEPLDCAILFAPAGELVPLALAAVRPGGVVVCAEIHMSDLPSFPYALLQGERVLRSVANVAPGDVRELLALAPRVPIVTEVTSFPLEDAPAALAAVREGRVPGAAVLIPPT